MPLRKILNSLSDDLREATIGTVLRKLADGIRLAYKSDQYCVWLAEQEDTGKYFFYSGATEGDIEIPITPPLLCDGRLLPDNLPLESGRPNSKFIPILGTRFGQKTDMEYLKPITNLVGALEIPKEVDAEELAAAADLVSTIIWNHRASRFLRIENEIDKLLRKARKETVDWALVDPIIRESTHSDSFAVVTRKKGVLTDRTGVQDTMLGQEFYFPKIEKFTENLETGRWLRSIAPEEVLEGVQVFWMIVPLKTAHYKHNEGILKLTDKAQHYVILETLRSDDYPGRFLYSSSDRRLVEHTLTKYLEAIAEYRIEEMTRLISGTLPLTLPRDPTNDTKKLLKKICAEVYDVSEALVITPSLALQKGMDINTIEVDEFAIFSDKPFDIGESALLALMEFDGNDGSYLNAKHGDVIEIEEKTGIVFNVGNNLLHRFLVLIFEEPYSSFVTTEICSRVSARLQIFLQSCELQNDRAESLTQIAHVLRGPVNHALEDIRSVVRDKSTSKTHNIVFENARTEDDLLAGAINLLSRSRSITDSAKHLFGQLGSNSFQRRRVNIIQVLGEVRSSVELERKHKNITVRTRDETKKSDKSSLFIWGDEDLLWLMLYNLIENSIKYGRRDSVVTISLRSSSDGAIEFSVENEGDLIWEFDTQRIFMPYQRALSSLPMNGREGTGIGLPAANQIARAFNPSQSNGIRLHQSAIRSREQITGQIVFSLELQRA